MRLPAVHRPRQIRGLLVALGLAWLLAGAASSATAVALPPADYFGANIQPLYEKSFVPQASWNGLIADMNTDSLNVARADAPWSWVEPKAPVNGVHSYTWNVPGDPGHSMDSMVQMLAQNHVRLLAVLSLPPSWAGGNGTSMTPSHYADFEAYAQAFAQRYGEGGAFWAANPQLPYLPVRQFEIWGEANSSNFWTGSANASEYVKVLQPLSTNVHVVDPSAQVLASIGWQDASSYIGQMYQDGVKGSIDAIGFHPYSPDTPGILGLTQQLRSALVGAQDPGLPIFVSETGQPAAPSGPGADYAYNGAVSDNARAATLSLAGDALARGDCGVQSFDVYALVGSGTNAEPDQEGYMGILDYRTGSPNVTGSTLIAESNRWRSAPTSGLVLCGGGATPSADLLPLGLTLTHSSPTCVSAVITYLGNPLEAAELVLRTADGRVDPAATNAFGQAQMCLQDGPPITSFTAYAELSSPATTAALTGPDVAQSATYACPVTTAACTPITGAPAGGLSPGAGGGRPGALSASQTVRPICHVYIRVVKVARTRTTLRARLACSGSKQPTAQARAMLERRGHHKFATIARLKLTQGRWHSFSVRLALHAGDRLTATVPANAKAHLASLQTRLLVTKKLLRTLSHPAHR